MILGIDIGNSSSVLATIQRGSVSIVRNELADRLTPSLVLFVDHQRYMGDHAVPLVRANAKNTCKGFKNILGELYACSDRVNSERAYTFGNLAEAENGLAGYNVNYGGEQRLFSAVRIMAAFLTKLKQVAEASQQRVVQEVVIACPSWYRDANRAALLDAAKIAGLSCLRVISDMTAVALDYGLYRRLHFNETDAVRVAFVGIGHGAASVCIAAFTSVGMKILSECCDPDLGGRNMDALIVQHYAESFEKQHKINPLESAKARLKLEEQAEKVKKIVSANSEAVFHIECLVEDYDCSGVFTRDAFEALCAEELKPRLNSLLLTAIRNSGLEVTDISSVEITGGCTRIPWIQRSITEVFNKDVSKTLSADETVARGCALQGAMASMHYKVKDYIFNEKLLHPIQLSWTNGEGPLNDNKDGHCEEVIIHIGTETNSTRKYTFLRSGPFQVSARYLDSSLTPEAAHIGTCDINLQSSATPQQVQVCISFTFSGLFAFSHVYVKEERVVKAENGEENAENVETVRIDIPFKVTRYRAKILESDITAYAEAELNMDNDDRLHREKLERLNELETTIYRFRDDMSGKLAAFILDEEKAKLSQALVDAENWIYDHQDDPLLHKSAVVKKADEFNSLIQHIYDQEHAYMAVDTSAQHLSQVIQEIRAILQSQNSQYAHIAVEEKQKLAKNADDCESWIASAVATHKASPPNQPLKITHEQIDKQREALQNMANEILSKPPPAPPKAPETVPEAPSQPTEQPPAGEEPQATEANNA